MPLIKLHMKKLEDRVSLSELKKAASRYIERGGVFEVTEPADDVEMGDALLLLPGSFKISSIETLSVSAKDHRHQSVKIRTRA